MDAETVDYEAYPSFPLHDLCCPENESQEPPSLQPPEISQKKKSPPAAAIARKNVHDTETETETHTANENKKKDKHPSAFGAPLAKCFRRSSALQSSRDKLDADSSENTLLLGSSKTAPIRKERSRNVSQCLKFVSA